MREHSSQQMTRAVLGIDAAWTLTQPSGVALVIGRRGEWRLVSVKESYQSFRARALEPQPGIGRIDGPPEPPMLLATALEICGRPIDLVAVDMPLAYSPIVGRRAADTAVSRSYGGRGCGTHSPSELRPGRISDDLRLSFANAGYSLCTEALATPGLIEVYPHPALVELASASYRLPYKAGNVRRYWPPFNPSERRLLLYEQWRTIIGLLEMEIEGVSAALPDLAPNAMGREMKAYEDKLDAVVCAWVAVCALEGRAKPFGDDESAIWIPHPPS